MTDGTHSTTTAAAAAAAQGSSADAEPIVVSVERDYSRGLVPQFETQVPPEIQDRIAQCEFERVVGRVNQLIAESERVTWGSACENIAAYLTCFITLLFCKTHSQKVCLHHQIKQHQHQQKRRKRPLPFGTVL